jgi:hypothetical protein
VKFVKLTNGNYVNFGNVFSIYAIQDGPSNWNVEIAGATGVSDRIATPGSFSTEAAAQAWIQDLVQGFDASTL